MVDWYDWLSENEEVMGGKVRFPSLQHPHRVFKAESVRLGEGSGRASEDYAHDDDPITYNLAALSVQARLSEKNRSVGKGDAVGVAWGGESTKVRDEYAAREDEHASSLQDLYEHDVAHRMIRQESSWYARIVADGDHRRKGRSEEAQSTHNHEAPRDASHRTADLEGDPHDSIQKRASSQARDPSQQTRDPSPPPLKGHAVYLMLRELKEMEQRIMVKCKQEVASQIEASEMRMRKETRETLEDFRQNVWGNDTFFDQFNGLRASNQDLRDVLEGVTQSLTKDLLLSHADKINC